MPGLDPLVLGHRSEQCRALAAAMNRRLEARSLQDRKVEVFDGPMTLTREIFEAIVTCAWALGARLETLKRMERENVVPVGVARMIRNPGLRTEEQKRRGMQRIAKMLADRKERPDRPKFITAASLGLTFQNLFGPKGEVTRGAGHYTAGGRASNAAELEAQMRSIHRDHQTQKKPFGGIAYEALVADDGTIGFGNPMHRKSAAVAKTNTGMVSICCPGTKGDRMTTKQKASVEWLMDNWHTSVVPAAHRLPKPARSFGWKGHKFYPLQSTDCPDVMVEDYKEIWK